MNIATLDAVTQKDIERRIRKGHGELVEVGYEVLSPDGESVTDATMQHYIGKMSMGQTGRLIPFITRLISNGLVQQEVRDAEGTFVLNEDGTKKTEVNFDLASLSAALGDDELAYLISVIMGETPEWVKENFDLNWAIDVLAAFFKHNDFLRLITKATNLLNATSPTEAS